MKPSHLLIVPAVAAVVLLGIGFSGSVPTRMLNVSAPNQVQSRHLDEPANYRPTYRFVEQGPLDLHPINELAPYEIPYPPETERTSGPDYIPMISDHSDRGTIDEVYEDDESNMHDIHPATPLEDERPTAVTAPASGSEPTAADAREAPIEAPIRRSNITASIY